MDCGLGAFNPVAATVNGTASLVLADAHRLMRRKALLLAAMVAVASSMFLSGCGDTTSGNVNVVLVDTSKSFCQALPNCETKIDAAVDDNLADLSKQGGSLRLLLIGSSNTGAPACRVIELPNAPVTSAARQRASRNHRSWEASSASREHNDRPRSRR